jgi:hypothetical protein
MSQNLLPLSSFCHFEKLTKDKVYEEILGISEAYSLNKFQINKSIKKSEFV